MQKTGKCIFSSGDVTIAEGSEGAQITNAPGNHEKGNASILDIPGRFFGVP